MGLAPEISAAIITVVLTFITSTAFWLLQKYVDKKRNALNEKKTMAETEQIEAETDNVDAETIVTLHNLYNEVINKLGEVNDSNVILSKKIVLLEGTVVQLEGTQEDMVEKNKALTEKVSFVQKENKDLREIVASEQLDKRRLKVGVRKLIEQMKENGIDEPAFSLEELENLGK